MARDDFDWENRTLCRDESCIGVIGPDGRCKECGKLYEGQQPAANDQTQTDSGLDENIVEEDSTRDDDDWENRVLCSDESCIGVMGPDGRCQECGKPSEGS